MGGNQKIYSANPNDYKLLEEVGHGASATVYRTIYLPLNEVVAVKCLDLDRCNSNLDDIRREAQTMSLIDHPNVVIAYCSFVVERNLWVVMPFMAEGSCLHLMKITYPDGFEEDAIGSILKETLKALEYLHFQGHIHRDVKAGNILLDNNGVVKLADFGVSACMFDTGDRQRSRNTFVGTPCWMAPEVLQPGSGYNTKADIWSFGITALELAHGHAPFSKYPPMKVLLMTIQNAPPGLDYDRDKKFSKSFKEMVAMCLVKDQTKRPTAEKLLKHSFFKNIKPSEITVKKLFDDLPPLWNRVKALQLKDEVQLALKKMPSAEQEALSQSEYQRGVSAWNFDIEDLKAQASLVKDDDDDDELAETREHEEIIKSFVSDKGTAQLAGEKVVQVELSKNGKSTENEWPESGTQGKSGLKKIGTRTVAAASTSGQDIAQAKNKTQIPKIRQTLSGPLMPGVVLSHSLSERARCSERCEYEIQPSAEKNNGDFGQTPNFSGPLLLPNRASANSLSAPLKFSGGYRDSLDDKSKANLVQKGRFSVTSENFDLAKDIPLSTVPRRSTQGLSLRKSASVGDWTLDSKQMELSNSDIPTTFFTTHLQTLYQQTSIQQDLIINLFNTLQPADVVDATKNGKLPSLPPTSEDNGTVEMASPEKERLLQLKISELQARLMHLTSELNTEKLKYFQLQEQLNTISCQEENGDRREE